MPDLADRLSPYNVSRLPAFSPVVSYRLGYALVKGLRTPVRTPLFGDEVRFASGLRREKVVRLEKVPA